MKSIQSKSLKKTREHFHFYNIAGLQTTPYLKSELLCWNFSRLFSSYRYTYFSEPVPTATSEQSCIAIRRILCMELTIVWYHFYLKLYCFVKIVSIVEE